MAPVNVNYNELLDYAERQRLPCRLHFCQPVPAVELEQAYRIFRKFELGFRPMKLPLTGGCVCGEVRYECHCRDCQQVSGGPYIPVVVVPLKHFKITKGTLQHHATPSLTGGHNLRGFCAKCGSRLTGAENPERGIIGITASSLDDASWFKPTMDIFVSDAQAWDMMDPESPKHQHNMPR